MFQVGLAQVSIVAAVLLATLGPKRWPVMLSYLKKTAKKLIAMRAQIRHNGLQPERIMVRDTERKEKSTKK